MNDYKELLRRFINRARVSPHPVVRWSISRAREAFRMLGWMLPGLHLGWMAMLRDARWDGDDLVLRGWSYVRGTVHGGSPRHAVYLRRSHRPVWLGGRVARATVRHVIDPDVLSAGQGERDYSGSTWEARFSAADLAAMPMGEWQLWAKSRGGRRRSWGRVALAFLSGTPLVTSRRAVGGKLIGPTFDLRRGVHVATGPIGLPVDQVTANGRTVSLALPAAAGGRVETAVLRGTGKAEVPLEVTTNGDHVVLTATVPSGSPRWTAVVKATGEPITMLADELAHRPDDASPLFVRPALDRSVQVIDVPHFVEVDTVQRDDDHLTLRGTLAGDPAAFSLVLAAPRAEIPVVIESVSSSGNFIATASLRVGVWGGVARPAARGAYVLEGRVHTGHGGKAGFATFVSDVYLGQVPTIDARDDVRLRFELSGQPQLQVAITRPRAHDEYGTHNQRQLFQEYALAAREPMDAVYFESFFGRSATCNPRAIDAEVARRRPDLPRYWSVDDLSIAVPDGAVPVVIGTREWWQVRESARWVVTNEWLRGRYVKQPFQTVLQTWHGSMYKRIGLDRIGGGQANRARAERANWDMFISQNGDTTPIIQQAYEFQGDDASAVLEIGYPRNDELTDIRPDRIAEIRRRIGIPEGSRVVMYAPTWREPSQNVELLSLTSLADEIGPGFTLLQRGHVRTLEETANLRSDGVIDVGTYPQINELFMVTDLLITDYSSMMFDYSVTGRPMLFYTPDIEEYTDPRVRGAYFDLEELAPGPVVRTVPEVIDRLRSMDDWADTFTERYRAWHKRFNHLDDGQASARAVDALFAFEPGQRLAATIRRDYAPTAGEDG